MQGDLYLKMNGDPYYGEAFPRVTTRALLAAQVTNYIPAGGGTTTITITVQHRNSDDTGWTDANAFAGITSEGLKTLDCAALKEWIRYKVVVAATNRYEGACIFFPAAMWLLD